MRYNTDEAQRENKSSRKRLGIDIYDAYFLGQISSSEYKRLKNKSINRDNCERIRTTRNSPKYGRIVKMKGAKQC